MGKGSKASLTHTLNSHIQTIHETFQMLDENTVSSLQKVDWSEVTKLGDEISKQATVAGMLWSGEGTDVRELDENMGVYFNLLQGFLLLCHGSMVGAGPTLCGCIRASAKQVVNCSLSLFQVAVSCKESHDMDQKLSIPQIAGSVWEACSSLKKTPTTNHTAIGRAIAQVAVSVKDVLREMNELKLDSTSSAINPANGAPEDDSEAPGPNDDNGSIEDSDLGNDLSPEEMAIAQSTTAVVSDMLVVIKELIRFITGLLKQSNSTNKSVCFVDHLERLLEICQEIGVQIDELGAGVYPPQEVSQMKETTKEISSGLNRLRAEVQSIGGTVDGFFHTCEGLDTSLRKLGSDLGCLDTDLVPEMQNLAVGV